MADFIADSGREKPLLRDIDKKQEHKPETNDKPLFGEDGTFQGVAEPVIKNPIPKVYLPEGAVVMSDKTERKGDDLVRAVNYKMESPEPETKMTKKCPGCGSLIKSNWKMCMQCRELQYREAFHDIIIPLFEDNLQDPIYVKDMMEAMHQKQSYMSRFVDYLVQNKLIIEHKEKGNRRNFTLPEKYRNEPDSHCEYCGVKVRRNHISCKKHRPQWIKDCFSRIYHTLSDGEYHPAEELIEILGYSSTTGYRLLRQFAKRGWVKNQRDGQRKVFKLWKNSPDIEPHRAKIWFKGFNEEKEYNHIINDEAPESGPGIKISCDNSNLARAFAEKQVDLDKVTEEFKEHLLNTTPERIDGIRDYGLEHSTEEVNERLNDWLDGTNEVFDTDLRGPIIKHMKQAYDKGLPIEQHLHILLLLELEGEGTNKNQSLGDGQSQPMVERITGALLKDLVQDYINKIIN